MQLKHEKGKKFIESGLFHSLNNFQQLEKRVSALPVQEIGDAFEVFAEAYFATQKVSQAVEVWPEKSIPSSILENLGLTARDMGVDGFFRKIENHFCYFTEKDRITRE